MIMSARRSVRDLAVDACTAMVLVTLAWGGLWTALSLGLRTGARIGGLAAATLLIDRLLRTAIGSPSVGARLVASLLLVTTATLAAIGGSAVLDALRP